MTLAYFYIIYANPLLNIMPIVVYHIFHSPCHTVITAVKCDGTYKRPHFVCMA
jgi:hypothetical protein